MVASLDTEALGVVQTIKTLCASNIKSRSSAWRHN